MKLTIQLDETTTTKQLLHLKQMIHRMMVASAIISEATDKINNRKEKVFEPISVVHNRNRKKTKKSQAWIYYHIHRGNIEYKTMLNENNQNIFLINEDDFLTLSKK